ncbi:DUF134 domain-containing protein [Thermanaeromonas sp. C210]|uniref:DUF134 domain-containing protein n=1 Tax=Thermanaeromonas sp. C210 TaxID=2731925 RepID=UPI00155CDA55|nr:DUF134 domain-containing protein [Thermanaeromonas sp. C210]GFN22223.1 UPF0251 protein [Thermanaeromonas sp. C210]
MPRPPKCRRVEFLPQTTYFKPAGVPLHELEEVTLAVEELEAIRLKDLEGLEQEDCAARMEVSRPTFFRILNSARAKIAEALINGKAIKVEGGCFRLSLGKVRCRFCGREWAVNRGEEDVGVECPHCRRRFVAGPLRRQCRRGWEEGAPPAED